jgi:hypothetical protein
MNIRAKLSLACILFAFLTLWYARTLNPYEIDNLLILVLLIPIIGIFLAFGAATKTKAFLLILLHLILYPFLFISVLSSGCPTPPSGPDYWDKNPGLREGCGMEQLNKSKRGAW